MMWFICLLALGWWWWKSLLPLWEGELKVTGLTEPVEITRDAFGVPHIRATSIADAVFAQGFVHAQDRLWQMELNRLVGAGRMAELFGRRALAVDRFQRRFGAARAARTDLGVLSDEERAVLDAYCAGVNAAIAERGWRLPLEFWLSWHKPAPWQPIDCLTWIYVMASDLCSNWEQELLRGRLLAAVGPERAAELHLVEQEAVATLPPGGKATLYEGLADLYREARLYLPNGGLPGGSNAWVVAGRKSKSGRPLVASDPHLVGRLPSVWHEAHLEAPGLKVFGASLPGVPLVIIGHSDQVAWGVTNSFADVEDLYLEELDGDRYRIGSSWLDCGVVEEVIKVRGGPPQTERVTLTRHGPLLYREGDQGLALRWVAYDSAHPIATLLAMNQAPNAEVFYQALEGWHAPSLNVVFGDRFGTIGYSMVGTVPVRARGTGLAPVPGGDGEYEWVGTIPFEELPHAFNPETGYLVTANNPVLSRHGHHLSWDFMGSARAGRIEELLLAKERLDAADFAAIQTDTVSLNARRFAAALPDFETPHGGALELLKGWDGDCRADSQAAALYQVWLLKLMDALLADLSPKLRGDLLGVSENPLSLMAGHTGRYTGWVVDLMEQGRLEPGVLQTTLDQAMAALGTVPTWGSLHRLCFRHAFNLTFLNGPEVGVGGDTDTPMQSAVTPMKPYHALSWCPSWRQVVDLADPWAGRSVLPTGQSGHRGSPHYLDQFPLWLEGRLRPHPSGDGKRLRLSNR